MNATEKNLRNLGWSDSEAKSRAKIIDTGHAYAEAAAATIPPMSEVGILYSGSSDLPIEPTVGFVDAEGRMTVGGCIPSPGMLGRILTLPWKSRGGDSWTMKRGDVVAVLGDGTEVTLGEPIGGVRSVEAKGQVYANVLAAALAITPESV